MAIDDWFGTSEMVQCSWTCGYCGLTVAGTKGFYKHVETNAQAVQQRQLMIRQGHLHLQQPLPSVQITGHFQRVLICPNCEKPTFFDGGGGKQMPGASFGSEVAHLPREVEDLYKESRNCVAVSAFTASVLATRKLLMNVSVYLGANPNESFQKYVTYLADNGYVPPNATGWVDHIRNKGNEATHEIPSISGDDAKDLLTFMEMILKLVFEFPNRIPGKPPATGGS